MEACFLPASWLRMAKVGVAGEGVGGEESDRYEAGGSVKVRLKEKFIGAMIGSALGDAIGEIAFRYPNRERLSVEVARAGEFRYTDDTAMAIGLAESLNRLGRIDPKDLGDTFCRNYLLEPWRGYASGPPKVFAEVRRTGRSYVEVARALFAGSGSFGNGAAMRVAPVGLFFCDSEALYDEASHAAEVTHAHPVGKDGAAVQGLAVAQAVQLDPREPFPREAFLRTLVEFCRTREIREKMEILRSLLMSGASPEAAARRLGQTVAVHESMPFSLYAFLRTPGSFEESLFCAVLHGGDRDTLGAMTGAISGAYLGVGAIPAAWREKLENAVYIEDLAAGLADRKGGQ